MSVEEAFVDLPSFDTERLLVRPMEVSDVEAMFAIKSDPKVAEAYGTEPHVSIGPVLEYGLDGMRLNRIEACPLAENAASNALLLELGFRYEGSLGRRVFFRGRFIDQYYYSLLKSEWNHRATG